MALPPEVRASYTTIIDDILSTSDLSTISEKRIRKALQEHVEYDITPQKAAIKDIILERFDIFNAKQSADSEPVPSVEAADPTPQTNGRHASERSTTDSSVKRKSETDEASDASEVPQPKTKKRKHSVDNDAAFAAKLQAEEDKRARPTRNGASRKTANIKKKRTPKKKTASKVTGSDDSDVEKEGTGRKVNRETGFHKPLNLSPALSALFDGDTQMSRPQVTKRIWQYIKSRDLQDPGDKRFIVCDEQLQGLFKQDKVNMFTMTKLLNQHMYAQGE